MSKGRGRSLAGLQKRVEGRRGLVKEDPWSRSTPGGSKEGGPRRDLAKEEVLVEKEVLVKEEVLVEKEGLVEGEGPGGEGEPGGGRGSRSGESPPPSSGHRSFA